MNRPNIKIIALFAAALVGSSVAALAAEETKGVVQQVDSMEGRLRLQSGESFSFSNPAVLYGLLPGTHIGVSHNGSEGITAFDPHPATQHGSDID